MRPPPLFTRPGTRPDTTARWLAAIFTLAALPLLIWLAVIVPPGEAPDEVAHLLRADSIRHGQLAPASGPIQADAGLLAAGFAFPPGTPLADKQGTRPWLDHLLALEWEGRTQPIATAAAAEPPVLYLPATVALAATQAARQGPAPAIIAARLINALLYATLATAAIALSRRGGPLLFAILALPMSLSLGASATPGGLVIALAALSAALLTRLGPRSWWTGTALLAVAALHTTALLPLALAVPATVPGERRRSVGQALAGLLLALAPAVAWAALRTRLTGQPLLPSILPAADPAAQQALLLDDPARLLEIPWHSLQAHAATLWHEAIGVLGTLDVVLPAPLYAAWVVVLATSLLASLVVDRQGPGDARPHGAITAVVAALLAAWLTIILQDLAGTAPAAPIVDTIQGRDILPIAAFALPLATIPLLPLGTALRSFLALPVALLALATLALLPLLTLTAYYVR